jgi:hypothetical protein
MNTRLFSFRGIAGLGAALGLTASLAAGDAPAQADAFPSYESYIKISGEAPWMTGDPASFATRSGTPNAGAVGIEDLYFTKDLTNSTTIVVDGHALEGVDDYLASLNLTTDKMGSVEVGYKRFRTFYDGVGGFFPNTDQFERLSPEQLHVDRSSFWANATLARPGAPVFTISYHNDMRTGEKDSTEWAAVINPLAVVTKGALVGTALPANTPFIAPNVLMLDERHQVLDIGMKAEFGNTTETFKATTDWVDNNDARNYAKYPGSKVTADPTVTVNDDQESRKATTWKLLNQTETKFNERIALDTGITYSHVNSENGGSWITPAYNTGAKAIFTADTAADIYGGSQVYDCVGNAFLKFTPNKDWLADVGFRDESSEAISNGGFTVTSLTSTAKAITAANTVTANDITYSNERDHVETPEASLEFLGIDRLCLYGSIDDQVNHGYQHWINPYAATTVTGSGAPVVGFAPPSSVFFQEANQAHVDAKIGANWNPSTMFKVRLELFRKDHQNRLVGDNGILGIASYGSMFVNGYTFTGVKLSVECKPLAELSFSTSYQPQGGNMSVTANVPNGGLGSEVTSGKARTQQIGETVNWTPSKAIYFQGNVSVVYSYIQTAYPIVLVSSTTNIATPIQNANNNYVSGSALCGFVVDKMTDLQIQGYWQKADNYNPQIATGGQAYGSSFDEERLTVGFKRKLTERMMAEGSFGYLSWTDPTTGGFTNYHGPLAYLSVTYSL